LAKVIFQAGVFFNRPLYPASVSTVIQVYDAETDVLVPLWTDREGTDALANPHNISSEGFIKFYANPGRYNIVATNGTNSRTWPDVILNEDSFSAAEATTSYTLSDANSNQWMELTGSNNINITLPNESDIDLGGEFVHIITNMSSGTVQFVEAEGVTAIPPAGGSLIFPQNGTVGVKKLLSAPNAYIVFGVTVNV
jgi:hypothetical protein